MPWYKFIDNDLDICDPDSYLLTEEPRNCVDGQYLHAIFADPIADDPLKRPDLDSTPGLLFYIIRALAKHEGQPKSLSPPVPLEVRMSDTPARRKTVDEKTED
ncbi:hypothetical protein [Pararcticibacter amylolyticus]|uniref:Uncharacterized protein n=1 Tax=Pararcticibacter amylolyticus TaxID=2173175 RepID=A0A2U2PFQ8_9SPHI|nr:hypothetical protein [Pararcticibacter amylolyticus]PWG80213.1 hypothetical protein DDR33_13550 [Pararcticibacter amylolyticus]